MNAFLNAHILQPAPLANLNRDDTGAPKDLVYGGVTRARWSSQSLKRAARVAFEGQSNADRTSRSKIVADDIADRAIVALRDAGETVDDALEKELRTAARKRVNSLVTTKKPEDGSETLIWLAEHESQQIMEQLVAGTDADCVQPQTASLSIAGFGRMFAAAKPQQTEAAVQVAHAFSVNAASIDVDYFTAVDDLAAIGAGHLDVAAFTSGVFYRYFNIDRRQLLANWSAAGEADATQRLEAFLGCLFTALPTGKRNATAPHTPPVYIMLTTSNQGASLAHAFEAPIPAKTEGYLPDAISRLEDWATRLELYYPSMTGSTAIMNMTADGPPSLTFDSMVSAAARWILDGTPL
ncbi:type I-E CRISPR-associated protein Cas7/Cse4/CasC [Nocardioides sp. GY 10113]|uniref:type I-E CRISPR-associated protein Cas7/Cse4/CasC n=1 Tax=Nocardioides sp. GY 10113 TaxID=2569761 RepID=UPI0010A79020|nr:type I-E CRISPR-associated protein Cas7/Cse4/CasC [Nocardioides sp. GY 10113]TIC82198.1 type I-E CRISPR-associated protein Cas7/Cse4/CasC [Nocardioides sp. GY 10113]